MTKKGVGSLFPRGAAPDAAHKTSLPPCSTCGFTMVEVVVSTAIVSIMLVAALNTVAAARTAEYKVAERTRALLLGQALLAEILQQPYADPGAGPTSFGLEAGEITGNRSLFDDVDDYNAWVACPPQNKDSTVIPNATDYEQRVVVAWVTPANLSQTAGANSGAKRIQVTINRQGRSIITLTAYRTQSWTSAVDAQGVAP
jgi:prepilin-type N-terminal cleavage/methylation domain-containing protein